jgi:hypothetical protein
MARPKGTRSTGEPTWHREDREAKRIEHPKLTVRRGGKEYNWFTNLPIPYKHPKIKTFLSSYGSGPKNDKLYEALKTILDENAFKLLCLIAGNPRLTLDVPSAWKTESAKSLEKQNYCGVYVESTFTGDAMKFLD